MKKVIFVSMGTKGDFFPLLGIAREMKKRGYLTLFLSSEDHRCVSEKEGVDFEAIQSLAERKIIINDPDMWNPKTSLRHYFRSSILATAKPIFDIIERESKSHDCVLIINNVMYGALLAKDHLNLPTVSLFLHPYSHISFKNPAKDAKAINFFLKFIGEKGRRNVINKKYQKLDELLEPLNEMRTSLGLGRIDKLIEDWRHSVDLILDLWPNWYCAPKEDWPANAERVGFIKYDGPSLCEDWVESFGIENLLKEKPVVFAMGSGMVQDFDKQVKIFSETCRMLGRKGIFVSSKIEGQGRVDESDDLTVIEFAPFEELFKHAFLVVSHGGIGTVARILGAKIPCVITPLAYDQFDNAYHMEELGVGCSLPYAKLTPKKLCNVSKQAIKKFKKNSMDRKYDALLEKEDGLYRAVDLIEQRFLT